MAPKTSSPSYHRISYLELSISLKNLSTQSKSDSLNIFLIISFI